MNGDLIRSQLHEVGVEAGIGGNRTDMLERLYWLNDRGMPPNLVLVLESLGGSTVLHSGLLSALGRWKCHPMWR